jgi:phosphatidylglycerophosphatase A
MKSEKINELIATVFRLGYFPFAPGSVGSLAGLVLCLILHKYVIAYILTFFVLFAAGVITSGKVEKQSGQKDPSFVVIDEFACIFLVFLSIPLKPLYILIGFIIYRVLDVTKIPPIGYLEKIRGGWGVMLDDAMCGIYANLILQILTRLF